MQKKYIVRLTDEERDELRKVVKKLKGTSQKVRRAQILLKADVDGPNWTDQKIAEAFSCRTQTVENIRQRLVERGFQETLNGILRAPLDLIVVNILTPFAGTPFFERVKNDIVFSLIPYECRFKDERIGRNALERERRLYWHFYLRPVVFWRQLRRVIRFPYRSARLFLMMLRLGVVKRKINERPELF